MDGDDADPLAPTGMAAPPVSGDARDTLDDLAAGPGEPPSVPGADLVPGARLGRYKLLGRIGGGAMGVVWRARDPQLDRDVAIKVVHPSLARIPDAAARLLREARALAKVQHRAVVAVHDAGQDDDQLFVAMELVEGTTLGTIIRHRRPGDLRDWRRPLALVTEAGRGLAAAHAAGVLHRDFKPDNVLVASSGRVAVADFGLAEIVASLASTPKRPSVADAGDSWQVDSVDSLTLTGAVVGTPAYMSPEQLRSGVVDARSDQFGFCVTAYEALYGHRPFEVRPAPDQPPAHALLAEIEAGIIKPAPRDSRVPRWLRDAVVRGLAAAPDQRWPEMRALLAALQPPSRRRWWIALAAVAVIAAAVAVWAALPSGPRVLHPTKLFPLPMSQRIEPSTDGRRIAYADEDRVYIRDLDADAPAPRELRFLGPIDHVEFEGPDALVASVHVADGLALWRWYFTTGVTDQLGPLAGWSQWLGDAATGRVCQRLRGDRYELAIVGATGAEVFAAAPQRVTMLEIAPSGRRIAYFESDGFSGTLSVFDLDTHRTVTSPSIVEPSGLTWVTDERLVYSTGMSEKPTLSSVTVGAGGIGTPALVWGKDAGWFGYLWAAGRSLFFVDSTTTFTARWVDRDQPALSRELDPATVAAGLGWDDAGRPLGWQRVSGRIVTFGVTTSQVESIQSSASLDADIGNATRAGDVVIASVRRRGARQVVAVSLTGGAGWSRAAGDGLFVRCAGDVRPPCLLVRAVNGVARIERIDPVTGAVGASLPGPNNVADVAVSPDGTELVIADGSPVLARLDLTDPAAVPVTYLPTTLSTTRGVAHDPRGGLLVTGTRKSQLYQLIQVRPDGDDADSAPDETVVAQSSNDLLSVPRPSPTGAQVLVLSRRYLPVLYELLDAL